MPSPIALLSFIGSVEAANASTHLKQTELEKFKKAFLRKGGTISVAKRTGQHWISRHLARRSCSSQALVERSWLNQKRPAGMAIQVYRPSFAGSPLFLRCQERNFAAKGNKGRRKKGSHSPSGDH